MGSTSNVSDHADSYVLTREPCANTKKANVAGRLDSFVRKQNSGRKGLVLDSHHSPTILHLAHYDHLGLDDIGQPFCGASDDAASIAILMEIARIFNEAGRLEELDIVFLITDAEETNDPKKGVEVFMQSMVDEKSNGRSPPLDPDDIVLAISLDPSGRKLTESLPTLLLVGSEKFPRLHSWLRRTIPETVNETHAFLLHRDVIGSTFGNDADKLTKMMPAVWFINPGMSFYHTTKDCPETIDYNGTYCYYTRHLDQNHYLLIT